MDSPEGRWGAGVGRQSPGSSRWEVQGDQKLRDNWVRDIHGQV